MIKLTLIGVIAIFCSSLASAQIHELEFNSMTWGTMTNGKVKWDENQYVKTKFYIDNTRKFMREYFYIGGKEEYFSYNILRATISEGKITFEITSGGVKEPIKMVWDRSRNKLTIFWGSEGRHGPLFPNSNGLAKYENL